MSYNVKEIFYTLQGEGAQAGRSAVFCRFAGCNLWSGREGDRHLAICQFCDTDFVGLDGTLGGKFATAPELAKQIHALWPPCSEPPFVVFTGGEPLLQLDQALIDAMHAMGFLIAVETNGTIKAPSNIDWLCVSPKARAPLLQTQGHELKVVGPQEGLNLDDLVGLPFLHRFLQPMDGPLLAQNTQWVITHCLQDPRWRLSLQSHKMVGLR